MLFRSWENARDGVLGSTRWTRVRADRDMSSILSIKRLGGKALLVPFVAVQKELARHQGRYRQPLPYVARETLYPTRNSRDLRISHQQNPPNLQWLPQSSTKRGRSVTSRVSCVEEHPVTYGFGFVRKTSQHSVEHSPHAHEWLSFARKESHQRKRAHKPPGRKNAPKSGPAQTRVHRAEPESASLRILPDLTAIFPEA